jgi:hypothetical protein
MLMEIEMKRYINSRTHKDKHSTWQDVAKEIFSVSEVISGHERDF